MSKALAQFKHGGKVVDAVSSPFVDVGLWSRRSVGQIAAIFRTFNRPDAIFVTILWIATGLQRRASSSESESAEKIMMKIALATGSLELTCLRFHRLALVRC